MTIVTGEFYSDNLAALSAIQPKIAALVDTAPVPDGVTPATGRDGSSTFLISTEHGPTVWFGGSSMPAVSAPALFESFHSDGANVLLPGVLTGLEPRILADKLPAFAALFVIEEDPLAIKLAFHLHDYRDLISAGRLVFLEAGDLVQSLRTFFEVHPGYELPKHLLKVPHCPPAKMSELQRRFESAGEAVVEVQSRVVSACVDTLGQRAFGPLPDRPRVAVVGVDPTPSSIVLAGRIARGLAKLDWPHALCVPDSPGCCHLAARLRTVERLSADLVLFVNRGAGRMRSFLPSGLPVASWVLSEACARQIVPGELPEGHLVFAGSNRIADTLVRAGLNRDGIELCAVGADDTIYKPLEPARQPRSAPRVDVAILMDLPDDRPAAVNLTLASHLALWRAIHTAVQANVDRYEDALADELLDRAQKDSGTTLRDASIREQFADLLRTRIAPAHLGRHAAKALIADGYKISVWGENWPEPWKAEGVWPGPIPNDEALNRLFNAVGLVILPGSSLADVQRALDALAAGARVVCRAPDEPFGRQHPGLASVAPYLHFFRASKELTDLVREMRSNADSAVEQVAAAQTIVRREHTVSTRLRAIVDCLRQRPPIPAPPG